MYQKQTLANGVRGLFIENPRFNTTLISFNFFLPLKAETYSANALLPYVLSTCSEEYPDFQKLNIQLGNLYGATLSSGNDKKQNFQTISISVSVINDEYALGGDKTVTAAAELLASLIFAPKFENGTFCKEDTNREKRLMKERIRGIINDKRTYAREKTVSLIFGNNPYGISRFGTEEELEKITPDDLKSAWERLIKTAFLQVNVIGGKNPDTVFRAVSSAFSGIEREDISNTAEYKMPDFVTDIDMTEEMDITQGKLVMAFALPFVDSYENTAQLAVMADVFGGGPYSRLFTNVREKKSLCYYCACSANRPMGYMLVDSGVEADKCDSAQAEIINQLEIMKKGEFTDGEFAYSVSAIKDGIRSLSDSAEALNTFYAVRAFEEQAPTPAEVLDIYSAVTKEDVMNAASAVEHIATYRLLPKKEGI